MDRVCLRALTAAAALAAVGLAAPRASAQMAHIPQNDWRQEDRHDALAAASQRPTFAFEIRFGTYMPRIDSEQKLVDAKKTPFRDIFGLDCSVSPIAAGAVSQRLAFGLEADVLPIRIPYVGALGIGLGWSFTRFANQAAFKDNVSNAKKKCSDETTSLTIMPMHASVVLRFDELMRRTRVPIVPYGKVGPSFSFWRASSDSGTERLCGADQHKCGPTEEPTTNGAGWTPGMHFAVGGMLSLDFIDPRSTARLGETAGIGHVYVFGEFYSDAVTFGQSVLHVGATSWAVGLAADF